jgi:predicted GNAT superfamily acetyltransferase
VTAAAPASPPAGVRRRDATADDLPALAALNAANVPHLGAATAAHLGRLRELAHSAWVVEAGGELAGFVLVLGPGRPYDSLNYRWFAERYDRFAYVDRVAVAAGHRRRGIGRWLYGEVVSDAERWAPVLLCEVNVAPPNPVSHAFHAALGFEEVGRQPTEGGAKLVAMLARPLGPAGAGDPAAPAPAR